MTGSAHFMKLPAAAALAFAASAPALAVPPDFAAKADAYVRSAYPADGPGAAVIVTEGGKTVYVRGQGLADVGGGKPITPATVFRLGSITKQFSAAVVLQLADEGKLSLDDPVSKFVPGLPQPGAGATVRQLLNHTVGVQSYTGIPGWMKEENINKPYTTAEMIATFKDLPSPSKPGEKWDYNNSGYVLVGAVIEAVTGKPWHQAVEERIAKPLGLSTIRYGVEEPTIAAMAKGYTKGEGGKWQPAMKIHMSVPHAAGALVGTVGDLARWGQALHRGTVLSRPSYAGMTSPTKLPNGETIPYGYGLGQEKVRDLAGHGHSGGIPGFSTNSVYIPEKDLFVAVFANSDAPVTDPGIVMQRLAALAAGDPFPALETVETKGEPLEPLFGVYKVKEGEAERRFFARGGKLYTQRTGAPEQQIWHAGGDRFHYGPNSLTWFELKRDAKGAHVMEMHQQGARQAEIALRTGPVPPPPAAAKVARATLERYLGSYRLGRMTAVVGWGEGDTITVKVGPEEPRPARALGDNEFAVESVGAVIAFKSEGDSVTGMLIRQNGREMVAERVKE